MWEEILEIIDEIGTDRIFLEAMGFGLLVGALTLLIMGVFAI